jgi:alcohol dehydrogenase
VLLLSDAGVEAAGLTAKVEKALTAGGMLTVAASDSSVPSDSALSVVVRLAELYREKGCDAIVALGGGSVLDTAKGVNILAGTNSRNLSQWAGAGKIDRPLPPLAAIPTTSGTGSEATLVAVIADHDAGRKLLYTSTFLQPDIALLDPEMTASLPPFLTAATGMDALTHAMEAYYCRGHNPLSDAHALEAVRLIGDHLTGTVADPANREGRAALSEASNLAGLAFSNSMVGMVHTLGHSIGAVCGVHHGLCMALLLPWGIGYNLPRIEKETAQLLYALTGKAMAGGEESGTALVEALHRLNGELHRITGGRHPRCLSELRGRDGEPLIRREHLPEIAEVAMGDGSILYNPEELEYRDALKLLEEAFQADPEGEVSSSSS